MGSVAFLLFHTCRARGGSAGQIDASGKQASSTFSDQGSSQTSVSQATSDVTAISSSDAEPVQRGVIYLQQPSRLGYIHADGKYQWGKRLTTKDGEPIRIDPRAVYLETKVIWDAGSKSPFPRMSSAGIIRLPSTLFETDDPILTFRYCGSLMALRIDQKRHPHERGRKASVGALLETTRLHAARCGPWDFAYKEDIPKDVTCVKKSGFERGVIQPGIYIKDLSLIQFQETRGEGDEIVFNRIAIQEKADSHGLKQAFKTPKIEDAMRGRGVWGDSGPLFRPVRWNIHAHEVDPKKKLLVTDFPGARADQIDIWYAPDDEEPRLFLHNRHRDLETAQSCETADLGLGGGYLPSIVRLPFPIDLNQVEIAGYAGGRLTLKLVVPDEPSR